MQAETIRLGRCWSGSLADLPGLGPEVGFVFGPGSAATWGSDPDPSLGTEEGSGACQPHMESMSLGPGVAAAGPFLNC